MVVLTSPKKTISGFMTGTAAKGESAAGVRGASVCDADSGEGKGAEAEGRPRLLDGCCCNAAEDTEERPSRVSVEAFSMPAASAAVLAASAAVLAASAAVLAASDVVGEASATV